MKTDGDLFERKDNIIWYNGTTLWHPHCLEVERLGTKCCYVGLLFSTFRCESWLSIEGNSIRLGSHAHGILTKTLHKTLPWWLYCLSKTRQCAVIFNQISSKFTGEIGYHLLCILEFEFWCQGCHLSRILGQSEVSHNRSLDHSIDRLPLLWLLYFQAVYLHACQMVLPFS